MDAHSDRRILTQADVGISQRAAAPSVIAAPFIITGRVISWFCP